MGEGKSLTKEDALKIAEDVLGTGFEVLDKNSDDWKKRSEASHDLIKLRDEIKAAGGADVLKVLADAGITDIKAGVQFLADNKDKLATAAELLKKEEAVAKGEKSPEMLKIEELTETVKNMGADGVKKQEEFQAQLVREKVVGRHSSMLTLAAQDGIIIADEFIKVGEDVEKELIAAMDASDEEFGKLHYEKVVKPAKERQDAALKRLGIDVGDGEGVQPDGKELQIPGVTPGPAGSPFSGSLGRTGETPEAGAGESWGGSIGPDLLLPPTGDGK